MRGVDVEALSKREGDRIIIEGCISWRIVGLNGRMSETSNEFLNIPNALYAGNWWAKRRAIPTLAHEVNKRRRQFKYGKFTNQKPRSTLDSIFNKWQLWGCK